MPLRMMVTPVSLYAQDPTLFDGMQLPTMPSNPTDYPDLYVSGFNLDRDVLVNNLLMDLGEMDVIYTDPAFMKFAITQWSKKELPVCRLQRVGPNDSNRKRPADTFPS